MFKKKALRCHSCDRVIEEGEEFIVFLKMPSAAKMPYGMLDVSIAKHSDNVVCKNCHKHS